MFGLTFCQSVVPNAVGFVSRLPSPPAKVLPDSGPPHDWVVPVAAKSQPLGFSAVAAGMASPKARAPAEITTAHFRLAALICQMLMLPSKMRFLRRRPQLRRVLGTGTN